MEDGNVPISNYNDEIDIGDARDSHCLFERCLYPGRNFIQEETWQSANCVTTKQNLF